MKNAKDEDEFVCRHNTQPPPLRRKTSCKLYHSCRNRLGQDAHLACQLSGENKMITIVVVERRVDRQPAFHLFKLSCLFYELIGKLKRGRCDLRLMSSLAWPFHLIGQLINNYFSGPSFITVLPFLRTRTTL